MSTLSWQDKFSMQNRPHVSVRQEATKPFTAIPHAPLDRMRDREVGLTLPWGAFGLIRRRSKSRRMARFSSLGLGPPRGDSRDQRFDFGK